MYVNQIDNIIDKILDKLYLDGISKDKVFKTIVDKQITNFVEYRPQINTFIQQFVTSIDTTEIHKLINNRENINKVMEIIQRYTAYYYFLSLAYYYAGTQKEYRNNLIQYTKLQADSTFVIKNFFDTENNYQVISFYKIIKDIAKILLMTDLQKKTLNQSDVKGALNFLGGLERTDIDNYLLIVKKNAQKEDTVEINVHNLLKFIVFGDIYRNQEQHLIFEILTETEESKHEYTYIDIVVTSSDLYDLENFKQVFVGEENMEIMAKDLYNLVNESAKPIVVDTADKKNTHLMGLNMIIPIVDDFLRYHKDSERLDTESEKKFILPLINKSNAKNIQMLLLTQQRKKKENTKAQLIVNKIDVISDLYSETVKKNKDLERDVKKFFQGPMSYRKAVLYNYLDELKVINKIIHQGKRVMEGNEYFLELMHSNNHAYFNFKDFQKYGTIVTIESNRPIKMMRYSNIEHQKQMPKQELDVRTGIADTHINLVGIAIHPFEQTPLECVSKENLINIYDLAITYHVGDQTKTYKCTNGYIGFLKIIKYFYVGAIVLDSDSMSAGSILRMDYTEIKKLNPSLKDKVIYWIYDIEKDIYRLDNYENIKAQNFQEQIKYMNAKIYDDILMLLSKKLVNLIHSRLSDSVWQIEGLIESFVTINKLNIKRDDIREMIIKEYLHTKQIRSIAIYQPTEQDKISLPVYEYHPHHKIFRIKINTINPIHPIEHKILEAYRPVGTKGGPAPDQLALLKSEAQCKHIIEWKALRKIRLEGLNKYNMALTEFLGKYVTETVDLDFICKICGQILPIKQYVQDGSYDNVNQKFVTSYTPPDILLEDVKEYQKYSFIIKFLDNLISRMSLITGTNMLLGTTTSIRQKRKALVKIIIDIINRHNSINLKKKVPDEERINNLAKKFNIDKDYDSVFFFELDESILHPGTTGSSSPGSLDLNRLKINNMLLYFLLIFIVELNGTQISMMSFDKIANIYTFLKYGDKMFGNLLIRKNVTDAETVPIMNYPVLCYLIFSISYFLIKYKLWYYPESGQRRTRETQTGGVVPNTAGRSFNPVIAKVIIHSFVDIINSISLDANKMPGDYIYLLTTSKFYTQLNRVFKNPEIIKLLQQNHSKYNTETIPVVDALKLPAKIMPYTLTNPAPYKLTTRKLPSLKISNGIRFDIPDKHILYTYLDYPSDITNCPTGDNHKWDGMNAQTKNISCQKCNEELPNVWGEINRFTEAFYFELQKIAQRRCLDGRKHDFVVTNGILICSLCKKKGESKYTHTELDLLNDNLHKLEDQNTSQKLQQTTVDVSVIETQNVSIDELITNLIAQYEKEIKGKSYMGASHIVDKLIRQIEQFVNPTDNLVGGDKSYPIYLKDDVYIISHAYNGAPFPEPIIFVQHEKRITFQENHSHFKTDVYSYTDNRAGHVDVFYDAVSLELIGYKEKHKEYITVTKSNNYLVIRHSMKDRILKLGYASKYIDVSESFNQNKKFIKDPSINYHTILNNLIKEHVLRTRLIIDKVMSLLSRIKYYQDQAESQSQYLVTSKAMTKLIDKYGKLFLTKSFKWDEQIFSTWQQIRNTFSSKPVNWKETNVTYHPSPTITIFVSADVVNQYDQTSNFMIYYLMNSLIKILEDNPDKSTSLSIIQLYISIINYAFELYNMDEYKNASELKRFTYILNGSTFMVDLLKKGQGLDQSRQLEEDLESQAQAAELDDLKAVPTEEEIDELEDLKEEAEALDVETIYDEDEGDEYREAGDEE